ncbi:MAG: peptidoglycan bridge formation glycyltransferase FemA/FemB family protein [Candidatus Berkelbacteria bacterium]|nr:peptidoglycan bridge formation glycyltransferase FemA/FemB family protein [Candidatus Berkelbacteria bacterium]
MKSILQTKQWADFKASQGFEILKLGEIFVHKRKLPFGQNFLYLPEVDSDNITPIQIDELKKLTREQGSIFARLEFINRFSQNSHKLILSFGLRQSFEQVQPKWRQFVDLTKTSGEIISQMKQKGRYNVKLAERKGVNIERGTSEDLVKAFNKMYGETVARESITGRSLGYFGAMVDKFSDTPFILIYTARHRSETIAAALISFYGGVATYLYGGSSRRHKEVMAPYLMHWQIIKDAKEKNCQIYDLHGRARPEDEKSSWAGITRFKEQFGGEAVELLGSYDYVNKSIYYQIFKIAEKMRRKEH